MIQNNLDHIYHAYGFRKANVKSKTVKVYTYDTGYFHNADVVASPNNLEEANSIKKEFENAGYSSQIRQYTSIKDAEDALFDGFFAIKETKKELLSQYQEYCRRHKLTTGAEYTYIPGDFVDSEKRKRESDIPLTSEIFKALRTTGPQLIVVEAAAGFGKTTTVYEVLKSIVSDNEKKIPFLAELSKNRQAQIFKYVLLDEINRQFPTLNLSIVTNEIKNGRIILIIDGFDELLKKTESGGDDDLLESTEPMLETISHLLKGDAKIILTTRKTALFSGDGFHCWEENHALQFSVRRFTLQEPNIEKWVGKDRKSKLLDAGFDLSLVPNPVLLSWLRGLNDESFEGIISNTESIIENYFKQLLDREQGRQELTATADEQKTVFIGLANHLIEQESTTDSKENIEKEIAIRSSSLIKNLRYRYSSDARPSEEQLIEKLSLHALLDRKPNGAVGFVNDFVFGYFIGESAIESDNEEWIVEDERFADYAITSFRNRGQNAKDNLWETFNFYINLLGSRRKYQADFYLKNNILREYNGEIFEEDVFSNTFFGKNHKIQTSSFANSIFTSCKFDFNNINQSYFLGCKFYNCTATNLNNSDIFFGCSWEDCSGFDSSTEPLEATGATCTEWERHVLTKIWPPGAARLFSRRAITTMKMGISPDQSPYVDEAIESLKRKGILEVEGSTISVNLSTIKTIKELLGRTN